MFCDPTPHLSAWRGYTTPCQGAVSSFAYVVSMRCFDTLMMFFVCVVLFCHCHYFTGYFATSASALVMLLTLHCLPGMMQHRNSCFKEVVFSMTCDNLLFPAQWDKFSSKIITEDVDPGKKQKQLWLKFICRACNPKVKVRSNSPKSGICQMPCI